MRKRRGRGWKLGKFESVYFLNHSIPISSFTDDFLKFISRGLIFAKTKKFAKSRNLIHVKINPRKVVDARRSFIECLKNRVFHKVSGFNIVKKFFFIAQLNA